MGRFKRRRPNATGRGDKKQFVSLDYHMVKHVAWRTLSGNAIKILIFINSRFNGGNNGKIFISYRDFVQNTGLSRQAVSSGLKQVMQHGFLKVRKRGTWQGRKANEYELTYKHMGEESNRQPPSDDWKYFDEKQKCVLIPNHISQNGSEI